MPPTFVTGDIWETDARIICITTNADVRGDGRLVMGRGLAAEAATRYPGFQEWAGRYVLEFGEKVQVHDATRAGRMYGMSHSYFVLDSDKSLRLFQVKWHWEEPADLGLILYSTGMLYKYAMSYGKGMSLALNFPGIGNGKLSPDHVKPLLMGLPDWVSIYTKE